MFLFFEGLINELRKEFNVRAYNVEPQMVVTSIEAFPADYDNSPIALRRDTAYVLDYRKLRKYDPHVSFCAPLICAMHPDTVPDEVFFRERPVALVTCKSMEELLVSLSNRLYIYGGKSSAFADTARELLDCDTAEELLAAGFRILGNPIVVTDRNQRILMYTDPTHISDQHYREIVDMKALPTGHLDASAYFWSGEVHKNSMVVSEGAGELPTVICKTLSVGSRIIGYIQVFQFLRDFTEDDANAVDMLGNLLAVEFNRHPDRRSSSQERQTELFLRAILDETLMAPEYIRRQRAALGFDQACSYTVATAVVRSRDLIAPIPYEDLGHTIAAELQNTISIVYHNSILLLIRVKKAGDFTPEKAEVLLPYLEKYHFVLGVSNDFTDIRDIRKQAYLARKSLRFGLSFDSEKTVFFYKDYAIYHMIEQALKTDTLDVFCMPEVLRLYEYCRETGNDELIKTLSLYLKYGNSKSQTAAQLFVHVNTVKYRITQIENILGFSLDNSDTALRLMLSLRILEYSERFQEYEPFPKFADIT